MPTKKAARPAPKTQGSAKTATGNQDTGLGKTLHAGVAGFKRERAEQEKKAQLRKKGVGKIRRLWLPTNTEEDAYTGLPKNETHIVILDDAQDVDQLGFAFDEHHMKIDGSWTHDNSFTRCISEKEPCPLCADSVKSYHTLMLSIFNIRPWQSSKGAEFPGSRELLPLKQKTFGKILSILEYHIKEYGTTRGCMIRMVRDSSDPQSNNIGDPALQEGGVMFSHYSEEELVEHFGNEERKSDDGKTVFAEKNAYIQPLPYTEIFQMMTGAEMAATYGLDYHPTPGSSADIEQEWEKPSTTPPTRTAPARRTPPPRAATVVDGEDEDDQLPMGDSAPAETKETEETEEEFDPNTATWAELGAEHDAQENEEYEEALRDAAKQLELDVDDSEMYPTWRALGEAIDSMAEDDEEEGNPLEGEE